MNNADTAIIEIHKHKDLVAKYMTELINQLKERAAMHDNSKLESPEIEGYMEYTPKLKTLEYGSEEYKQSLKEMEPFLKNHYEANPHHPEHFRNGYKDMSFVDLIEMLCDWKAASDLKGSDIKKSLEVSKKRFNISDELMSILENTLKEIK